jgi:hypothetical protein
MKHVLTGIFCAITALFLGCGVSAASDPLAGVPVAARSFPKLEPIGLRVGQFMIYPSLEKEVGYTSNVFQTTDNEKSDRILTLTPSIEATASFGKHNLSASVKADRVMYAQEDDQDYTDYSAVIQNSYNFSNATQLDVGGLIQRNNARRLDSIGGDVVGAEPIRSDTKGVFAKMIMKPARFQWELGLNYADTSYKDVRALSNDQLLVQRDRDRSTISANVNVTYDSQRRFKPYFGLTYSKIDYDRRNFVDGIGFAGVNQDRDRIDILAGVNFEPTGKWRGSAKLGYGYERTDDNGLDNQGDTLVDIDLTYLYTPLTNFNFGFERFFSDDTSAVQGSIETRLSASVIHELTRQWILTAGVQYTRRDFQDGNEDDTLSTVVGAEYKLNRHFRLGGEIQHIDRESNRVNGDFEETKALIRLKSAF